MNGNLRRKAALGLGLILTLALLMNFSASAGAAPAKIMLSGHEFNTEPVALTAYVDWPNSFGAWGEDMVSKWITDNYGVSVDITWATTATSEELNLMMASGEPLPDFVIAQTGSAVARTLVREGFVEPLDELAKKYCPAFLELLPDEMYEIYEEPDGHLYHTVDWFADTKRLQALIEERGDLVQISGGNQTFMLNREYYEALGSPKVDTLEELKAYLKLAYETYPDIRMPLVLANTTWNDSQDAVNYFYRLRGGQEWLYPDETGAIKLCLDDPAYKLALKDLNDLYQEGIINKETLTITNDTFTTILSDCATFAFCGQDYNWFSKVPGGDQESGPILPILAPMAEGLTREKDLTLKFGDIASPGGTTAVFISVDSPNKARAIEYMAFKFTDEAQIAERYGIEGVTYEYKDDGTIMWTQEYNDYLAAHGWVDMSKKYGPNNQV
ncbi:MAG: extracellular solute-binding protein, partial [Clostridia bacterium]